MAQERPHQHREGVAHKDEDGSQRSRAHHPSAELHRLTEGIRQVHAKGRVEHATEYQVMHQAQRQDQAQTAIKVPKQVHSYDQTRPQRNLFSR